MSPTAPVPGAHVGVRCRSRPGDATFETLALLVDDVDDFRHRIWGRQARLSRRTSPGRTSLFDLDDVDDYLASSARWPTVRMVAEGDVLPPSAYCRTVRLGGRDLDDVVDATKVWTRFDEGATLVLQSLHRTRPAVGSFIRQLQTELGHPVQANAYLTPANSAGLAEHADVHDVFALQLSGTKRWWVDGLGAFTTLPGDVLYVPRGTRHRAETTSEASLHLTIGVIPVTYLQVVERCIRREMPDLDRPLPIGFRHDDGYEELTDGIGTALYRVRDHLATLDNDHLARYEAGRRGAGSTEPPRLASLIEVDRLTPRHAIRCVASEAFAGATEEVDRRHPDGPSAGEQRVEHDRITIDLGHRMLTMPTSAVPALRRLSNGAPVLISELPGLDPPSRLVVARRLVREGACVVDGD